MAKSKSRSPSRNRGRRRRRKATRSRSYGRRTSRSPSTKTGTAFLSSKSTRKSSKPRKSRSTTPRRRRRKSRSASSDRKHRSRSRSQSQSKPKSRRGRRKSSTPEPPSASQQRLLSREEALKHREQALQKREATLLKKKKTLDNLEGTLSRQAGRLDGSAGHLKKTAVRVSNTVHREKLIAKNQDPPRQLHVDVDETSFKNFTKPSMSSKSMDEALKTKHMRDFYEQTSTPLNHVEASGDARKVISLKNEITGGFTSSLVPWDVVRIPEKSTAKFVSTATGNVLHGTTPHAVLGGVHLRSSKLRPGGLHELYDKEVADDIFKDCTYIVGGEPPQLPQLAPVFRAQTDAEKLTIHGVKCSMEATANSGAIRYRTTSILAMADDPDPSARIMPRDTPLEADHPHLKALNASKLPNEIKASMVRLLQNYDPDTLTQTPKHQAYTIPIKNRSTVPLLAGYCAAGYLPWTIFAMLPESAAGKWMKLTKHQFQDCVRQYTNDDTGKHFDG